MQRGRLLAGTFGHGRAGGGNLADRTPREGNRDRSELVGHWLRRGGAGSGTGGTLFRLAGRFLRGNSAGTADVMDAARGAGVEDMGGAENLAE